MTAEPLVLLLAERKRFATQELGPEVAAALGRADAVPAVQAGARAQVQRYFELLPRGWPMAAMTRQLDAGDARLGQWLRADPAYVRPDINGARLLACGNLGLTAAEAEALLKPMRPLFGDSGFPISAPTPDRWYLHLPAEAKIPAFTAPEDALGDDLFAHLPDGSEGKRWRALLSEAQVMLHNNPVNAERSQRGAAPVNSLWFWGGGKLPDHVFLHASRCVSDDIELRALSALATSKGQGEVRDLRHERDWAALEGQHLLPALARLKSGQCSGIRLDFADGAGYDLRASQRWRFWRRVRNSL